MTLVLVATFFVLAAAGMPLAFALGLASFRGLLVGMLTPPVGVLLFVVCGITRLPLGELVRHAWPFIALQYGVLLLCLLCPPLVTALPRWLGY